MSVVAKICSDPDRVENRTMLREIAKNLNLQVRVDITARELCKMINDLEALVPDDVADASQHLAAPTTAAVKALLFIDFDQTITQGHMSKLTMQRGTMVDNPGLLTPEIMSKVFPSTEYVEQLKQFWQTLCAIPGLEVQIVSKGFENMVGAVLNKIKLEPMPAKIIGARLLSTLYKNQKGLYISEELGKRNVQYAFFVDDDVKERTAVEQTIKTDMICCASLTNGLTPEIMTQILSTIKGKLLPEPAATVKGKLLPEPATTLEQRVEGKRSPDENVLQKRESSTDDKVRPKQRRIIMDDDDDAI